MGSWLRKNLLRLGGAFEIEKNMLKICNWWNSILNYRRWNVLAHDTVIKGVMIVIDYRFSCIIFQLSLNLSNLHLSHKMSLPQISLTVSRFCSYPSQYHKINYPYLFAHTHHPKSLSCRPSAAPHNPSKHPSSHRLFSSTRFLVCTLCIYHSVSWSVQDLQ